MNKIIAIVGMCGSGKSVASEYLENKGYEKVYFGGVTMDKLKESGLEITPSNEKMMREKLRSELGMGAYAKILLPKIKELSNELGILTIQLYRNFPGESTIFMNLDKNFEEIFQIASCIHPRKRSVCKKNSGKDGPFRCFFP